MRKEIFAYAFEGLKKNKKTTIPVFLVLCISFSFLLFATCLLDSIGKTNDEFIIDTYGEWYAGLFDAGSVEYGWVKHNEKVTSYGESVNYGIVACQNRATGIGTVDEKLKKIGRLSLSEGRWPQKKNEIVVEADALCSLGYDYTLGQTISLTIQVPYGEENMVYVQKEYVLVGIIKEYSDLWTIGIPNADKTYYLNGMIISQEAAKVLQEEILTSGEGMRFAPERQVFIKVDEKNYESVRKELGGFTVAYNQCLNSAQMGKRDSRVYIVCILVITIIAVLFTYILQLKKQVYSYSVMRSVGMTRTQLARMVTYETLLLCIPAVIIGIGIGSGAIAAILRALVFGGSVPIKLVYNWKILASELLIWVCTVLLSRMVVFAIAVHAPLIGHLEMRQSRKKRIHRLRHACTAILCICFGAVIIFTGVMVVHPQLGVRDLNNYPAYFLFETVDSGGDIEENEGNFTDADCQHISDIPGITKVHAFSEYKIWYSFRKKPAKLFVINDEDWKPFFHFQKMNVHLEDFRKGKVVFMCFPKEKIKKYKTDYSTVKFSLVRADGKVMKDIQAKVGDVISKTIQDCSQNGRIMVEPYTLICSPKFLEKYDVKGFRKVYAYINPLINDKSIDVPLAEYCKKHDFLLANFRDMNYVNRQFFCSR